MSETSTQDKSEKPSEQKLRRTRKEGQVARSRELISAALIGMGGLLLLWAAARIGDFVRRLMLMQFELNRVQTSEPVYMLEQLYDTVIMALQAMLPIFLLSWLTLFLVGMVPGGWILSGSQLQPKFSRMNPLSGLKRMFSAHSLVELIKSILKVSIFFGVLGYLLVSNWPVLLRMNLQPLGLAFEQGLKLLALALILLALGLLVIAVLDVPFQRWSMLRKLRMTKQEVREEYKQNEGKPEIKARIRQLQTQFSRQRIDRRVPLADVVLVNPRHYAVAIQYDQDQSEAPFVVAKGVDHMALHIRAVAERSDKTVLEVPELTRAIYYSTRIDQEVPAGLYSAVAHVLMYVLQLRMYQRRGGHKPAPLPAFSIPDSLRR